MGSHAIVKFQIQGGNDNYFLWMVCDNMRIICFLSTNTNHYEYTNGAIRILVLVGLFHFIFIALKSSNKL